MTTDETDRISGFSDWYLKDQLGFDKKLIEYRYLSIKPMLLGPLGLELGSAEGFMTKFLINDFEKLTIVDGSDELLSMIPPHKNLVKIHSLFENFEPTQSYDSIILEHILEHVTDPIDLLKRAKTWLTSKSRLFVGVPNGNSFHRLAAVKMGLLKDCCQLNQRDKSLGHRRVYTPTTIRTDIEKSGLKIVKTGGVFFKPLSNKQIEENWDEQMIKGFYELGKDFPEHAAEIFVVCEA